jgi:hypothetical protein
LNDVERQPWSVGQGDNLINVFEVDEDDLFTQVLAESFLPLVVGRAFKLLKVSPLNSLFVVNDSVLTILF